MSTRGGTTIDTHRITVFVYAKDPISQAGIASQLRLRAEVLVVDEAEIDDAAVAVLVLDELDESATHLIRAIQRDGVPRVVVIAPHLDEVGVLAAVEAGACGFLRRAEAMPDRLLTVVSRAANGDGSVPHDLLGKLLDQVGRMRRENQTSSVSDPRGLSAREIDVLRLIADGYDTAEVAAQLCYSERTIKNVLHDVTSRLQLRNRSHAVAYALRNGLI